MGSKSRMQGKESSKQETSDKSYVGIDVCQNWLDVHILPADIAFRVPNTSQGHRQLSRRLSNYDVDLIVIEATGKWHRQIHRALHGNGYRVAVVNPLRARLFAEAIGLLAKTDQLDARMLAMFAMSLAPAARPPAPEYLDTIRELVQARSSAVAEQTALSNQRAGAETIFLRRQLASRLARIAKDIKALEAEILRSIKDDEGLAHRYAILLSIPGFGAVTAATLLVCLAELGSCDHKQIALLAGLAPLADQSGERDGRRSIRGGRAGVRHALYLAALTAARCNHDMKVLYHRLTAAGKLKKVALIAVARKLVVLANTLIREDRSWQTTAPIPA
jgi:transposase